MSAYVDIAVVGGGAAGIAAAVSAARAGCSTILLDEREGPGGTGGFSGLTTLCGLYDDDGCFLNNGFTPEFAAALDESGPVRMGRLWVLPYRPARFREVAAHLLVGTPRLRTQWNTRLNNVVTKDGRIVSLNDWKVGAVIDCSGNAEVASAVGIDCLATDERTQSPAIIFPLCNVARELKTPAAVARVLLPLARAGFPPLSFQPSLESDTITVKFTGQPEQARPLIEFLRQNISGFEHCMTPVSDFKLSHRAGRMIMGHYLLTGTDVRSGRKFPDAVARCAWPIEQWGTDGVAHFSYLAPRTHFEIPAGSLRASQVQNLFMAGKTISADEDAIGSARVMGCCLATGEAAGRLAAQRLASGNRT